MASKKIKGITIEIGADTSLLGKAIKDSEDKAYALQRELREVEKALKFDPNNVELLAQKQDILNGIVEETSKKYDTLKKVQDQVATQFEQKKIGEDVFRAFQREIIETENKLKRFGSQADGVENDVKNVGQSAEQSSEGFTIMKGALADLTSNAIQSCVSAIGDLLGSIMELDEATEEYRSMQSKLEGSATNFGYSTEYAKKQFEELYKYLGDDQMTTNAVTNLLGLGTTQESLTALTEGAIGVWASYGDSIPIESLTEAINETIQVGKVTGTFADTINWAKVSNEDMAKALGQGSEAQKVFNKAIKEGETQEDAFSQALASTSDQQERADIVARFLNDTYGQSKTTYDELSKSVLESNEAELQLKDTQSKLGEAIAPVNNAFSEMKSQALEKLTPLVEDLANKFMDLYNYLKDHPTMLQIITGLLIGLATAFGVLAMALAIQGLITGVTKAFALLNTTLLANPIVLIGALIVGLVATIIYLWNNCDAFRENVIGMWNAIKEAFMTAINFIIEFLTNVGVGMFNVGKKVIGFLKDGILAIWDSIVTFFTSTIPNVFNSIADIDLFDVGWDIIDSLWSGLKDIWADVSGWFSEKMAWVSDSLSWILGKKEEADNASKSVSKKKKEKDGSHANGLAYVPFDNYIAELHKGERVLTAKENQAYTMGLNSKGVMNVTQNIYVPTENPRELERQARRQLVNIGMGV